MNLKIERKETKTIPASEMEVGQVAQVVRVRDDDVSHNNWLIKRINDYEVVFYSNAKYIIPIPKYTVEPVQTIDTNPKTIYPAEMEDGQIGEIVGGCDHMYIGYIVQRNDFDLVVIGKGNWWTNGCRDHAENLAFKILPLQPGDKIIIE